MEQEYIKNAYKVLKRKIINNLFESLNSLNGLLKLK